jgi:hypothetical protein
MWQFSQNGFGYTLGDFFSNADLVTLFSGSGERIRRY